MGRHIHDRDPSQKFQYAWDSTGQPRIVGERHNHGNFRGYSNWNYGHHGHNHHDHGRRMSTGQNVLAAVLTGVGMGVAGELASQGSGMTGAERTGSTRLSGDFMMKIADGRYSTENLREAMAVRENAYAAGDRHGFQMANRMVQQLGYALQYQDPRVTMQESMVDQATTASSERFGRFGLIGQLFGIR